MPRSYVPRLYRIAPGYLVIGLSGYRVGNLITHYPDKALQSDITLRILHKMFHRVIGVIGLSVYRVIELSGHGVIGSSGYRGYRVIGLGT